MRTGQELVLEGAKKYLVELTKAAEKAKNEADEYMSIGMEMLNIHKEMAELDFSSKDASKKLDELKKRSDRVERIKKKNLVALCDKQSTAEIQRDILCQEIQNMEFSIKARRGA